MFFTKFYVEMPVQSFTKDISHEGRGWYMPDPIGNWGLVNDICRLVRAPQNIEEVLPVYCLCVVFFIM